MNAKMVITVPIETIPNRVNDILKEMSIKLDDISQAIYHCGSEILNENDLLLSIDTLDECRKKMSNIDLNIEDCYTILKGYVNYQYQIQDNKEEGQNGQFQQGTAN